MALVLPIRCYMIHATSSKNSSPKSRRFQLTLNEYNKFEEVKTYLLTLKNLKYALACHEVAPTTGHEHAHIFVCFSNTQKLTVQKLCGCHVERCMGSVKQNIDYIKKEGEIIWEYGEVPKGEANINESWQNFIEQIKEGTVDKDSKMYAKYRNYAKERMAELKPKKTYNGELRDKNIWIHGKPGTGKSLAARFCDSKHIYTKNLNKWWDGYNDEKVVILEDIDPDKAKMLAHHMKIWCDRYPFTGEVKGSSVSISPTYNLIVTSNYSIDYCFDKVDAEAIHRRFTEIEFK